VVLKLGERGALVANSNILEHIPAVKVDAVDATAAGDAFTAALAIAYAGGMGLIEAARYANFAGALAVTRFGAQPSMPTTDELRRFIQSRGEAGWPK
jgi:ribokinase